MQSSVERAILAARKVSFLFSTLLYLLPCLSSSAHALIIPDDRTAPWRGNVGVPGGIPNRTRIYKNIVTDLGADPTGVKDCSAIIQGALNKCPQGQVIYIPEGRFLVAVQINIPNNKSNRSLRGAGMERTNSDAGADRRTRRLDARDGLRALDEAAGRQGSTRKIDRLSRCLSRL